MSEAILAAILTIFIFGGSSFLYLLGYFWIKTLIANHRRRAYARRTLDNAVHQFVYHV